jgi:cobalt-zinc-cadmium efflux system membrane fusion protein
MLTALLSTFWSPFLASGALAHGGEDHGAPPPPPTSGDEGTRSTASSTTSIELVARWPAQPAAQALPLRVLISDWVTNAPVEGASVTLDVTEPTGTSLSSTTLAATGSPGIYQGNVAPRVDGIHAASVTVVAGELVDVVALPALSFGPPATPVEAPHDHDGPPWQRIAGVLVIVALVAGVIVALLARRRRPAAASLTTVALALFGLASPAVDAHGGEDHSAPTGPAPAGPASTTVVMLQKESQFLLGIRTALVELAPVTDRLEVPGVVTAPPERHAAVFAPQQGRVVIGDGAGARGKTVPLLGSVVKKGQVLAILEATLSVSERASFAVEASQAESEVTAARSRLTAAERNLARVAGLEGVVSQRDRDAAAVEVEQAQATVVAAEGRRSAYGSTERSTRIVLAAPISGILADVNVSPGEIVEPGRRAFLIVDPAELWVEAKVYEADLARMTPGASANVSVDAWPGQGFPGSLMALGEVIDPETRTVKAIFKVDNPLVDGGGGRRLKLGMFAHVQIGAGESTDVLVVPQSAILDVDGRHVVFVHLQPELFERREVALGRRDGNRVEVRGGVVAGDRVVTSGLLTLKNAPAAPAAAPPAPPAPPTMPAAAAAPKQEH